MRTPIFVRTNVTSLALAPLVERAVDHHIPSWHELVARIFPGIEKVAGHLRYASHLSAAVDERRNVAVKVIERLQARELDGLKRLQEVCAAGEDSAWPWICRVTQRKALDHVRDHAENLGPDEQGVPQFARLVELPEEVEDLLPASVRAFDGRDIENIVTYAERVLPEHQLAATRLHLLGDGDEAIAGTLGFSGPPAAYKAWHGAVMRLRYRFVVKGGGGG